MPQNLSPAAVVCLALALVAVIHAGLVVALTRGAARRQIELIQRAVGSARDPWREQRQSVRELHRRVGELAPAVAADPESAGRPAGAGADRAPAERSAAPASAPGRTTAEPEAAPTQAREPASREIRRE